MATFVIRGQLVASLIMIIVTRCFWERIHQEAPSADKRHSALAYIAFPRCMQADDATARINIALDSAAWARVFMFLNYTGPL